MSAIRVELRPDGVAVVTLDAPGKPVNTLSPALVEEFEREVQPILEDAAVKAVVLASAKPSFIAGADLKVLSSMTRAAEPEALARRGQALLGRIAASRTPVVAALHGAALGGGLEVVLACHYILASDHPDTVLGLPEVQLGLLPAAGGTQRLPRRVGLPAALPMLLTGKRVRARKAYRMGLVDAITTPGGIADTAVQAALALAERRLKPRKRARTFAERLASGPLRGMALGKAREQVMRATRGLYPAPLAILECVGVGLRRGMTAGLELEARHFGELVVSREGRNLVRIFLGMNELKKAPEEARPVPVRRVAVLGAGLMGSGIASVSLGRWPVVLRDVGDEPLSRGACAVRGGLEKQLRSGAITRLEKDRRWSRLLVTSRAEDLAGADIVIEAVFEDLELKRRVVAEVEEHAGPNAVIASNTSALPIHAIAAGARHPDRIVGMHYFSPVPKMPLLEVVVAAGSASWAVDTARAVGVAQGKSVIAVKDSPGFYTTRILAPYLNEAILLLEQGASIEALDGAMKDFGFPVGPMALLDEVGIDVGAHVARDLGAAFAARGVSSSDTLPRLAEAGYAGRKNGRGFYRYPSKGKGRKTPNPKIYAAVGGARRREVAAEEIQARLALVMVNEAILCLQEGVLASPRDGDLGAILGLGFPPFRGGPFRHTDAVGAAAVLARLEELAAIHGARFAPAPLLADHARSGTRFHPD